MFSNNLSSKRIKRSTCIIYSANFYLINQINQTNNLFLFGFLVSLICSTVCDPGLEIKFSARSLFFLLDKVMREKPKSEPKKSLVRSFYYATLAKREF